MKKATTQLMCVIIKWLPDVLLYLSLKKSRIGEVMENRIKRINIDISLTVWSNPQISLRIVYLVSG